MIWGRRKGVREAARQAARARPAPPVDWRPPLSRRFGIDGTRSASEIDAVEPDEPSAEDESDTVRARTALHLPLWRLDIDEVRLLLELGLETPSVFRLALLMLEEAPFEETGGEALLVSAAGSLRWDYDPVAGKARTRDEESRYRGEALATLMQAHSPATSRQFEILAAAAAAVAPPKRFAETRASLSVRQSGGRVSVLPRREAGTPGAEETPAVRVLLVGRRDESRLWAVAVYDGRPFARFGSFIGEGVAGAQRRMEAVYGIPSDSWTSFET
ncbi:hypothetical protein [Lutibaculum baratangense]|uniref:Uncharacterized protein n=1 Tax=Lutibaculum baratangense AMV1 TaxID=631454 RepID=V4TJ57_9HYPH|nr:hypothetical protein [Lutibaculum baratangense]ESR25958.1 hypothetical protein N177_1293 [Lutibaculum baratangense AMV1]